MEDVGVDTGEVGGARPLCVGVDMGEVGGGWALGGVAGAWNAAACLDDGAGMAGAALGVGGGLGGVVPS
jgi:hypothetical protein